MASNWIIVFGCCCIFIGENGSGFIWFFLCLIVGLALKAKENGWFESKTSVQPNDFWEYHFKRSFFLLEKSGKKPYDGFASNEAIGKADSLTVSNRFRMPSKEEKQKIVASVGGDPSYVKW